MTTRKSIGDILLEWRNGGMVEGVDYWEAQGQRATDDQLSRFDLSNPGWSVINSTTGAPVAPGEVGYDYFLGWDPDETVASAPYNPLTGAIWSDPFGAALQPMPITSSGQSSGTSGATVAGDGISWPVLAAVAGVGAVVFLATR
jgi:hypothetical protein